MTSPAGWKAQHRYPALYLSRSWRQLLPTAHGSGQTLAFEGGNIYTLRYCENPPFPSNYTLVLLSMDQTSTSSPKLASHTALICLGENMDQAPCWAPVPSLEQRASILFLPPNSVHPQHC